MVSHSGYSLRRDRGAEQTPLRGVVLDDDRELAVIERKARRVLDAHDADLLTIGANQAHFRDPDALVDARLADVVLLSSMTG